MKMMILTPTPPRRPADGALAVLASIFLSMGALLPLYAILVAQG
jgi:hypothetical protein